MHLINKLTAIPGDKVHLWGAWITNKPKGWHEIHTAWKVVINRFPISICFLFHMIIWIGGSFNPMIHELNNITKLSRVKMYIQ